MALSPEILKEVSKLSTREDVTELWNILRDRMRRIDARKLDDFYVGQPVTFKGRKGEVLSGTIEKLNSKTATVKVGFVRWNVSASFLKPVG